ncbi:MAG: flagellar hook-basal body complex protein FliE [Firmicutes bacterium]|nr:flagellar hook-basal body complex protein FliE [Bacillota bacterium]
MNILPVAPPLPLTPPAGGNAQKAPEEKGGSFADVLNSAVEKLNQTQVKADDLVKQMLTGEIEDIHQVTVAMQEAKLSMQLAVEVRNKIIEAYQEVSRMQI